MVPKEYMLDRDYFAYFGAYFFLDDSAYDFSPFLLHTGAYFDISKKIDIVSKKDLSKLNVEADVIEGISYRTIYGNGKYISSFIKSTYPCEDYDLVYVMLMTISREEKSAKGLYTFIKENFDDIGFLNTSARNRLPKSAIPVFDDFLSYHMNVEENGKYIQEWGSEDFLSNI